MTEEEKTVQEAVGSDVPFSTSDPAAEAEFDKYLSAVDADE